MADKKKKSADDGSLEEPSTLIQPAEARKAESQVVSQDESTLMDTSVDGGDPKTAKSSHSPARLLGFLNLYFIIFVLLLILAAGGIFASVKFNNKNATQTTKTDSLTDKQLSDLKSNTTLVGDAQQTLDIQGNSIFEGQVLMRNNLDVAGSLKVGGSLSLPAITVGGSSNFRANPCERPIECFRQHNPARFFNGPKRIKRDRVGKFCQPLCLANNRL
jgi:hypothetical protein